MFVRELNPNNREHSSQNNKEPFMQFFSYSYRILSIQLWIVVLINTSRLDLT